MDLLEPLDILEDECSRVVDALRTASEDDFARPTRCTALDVKGLVGHLWRDVDRLATCLDLEPAPTPTCDATTYFRAYDPVADAPNIAAQSLEVAGRYETGAAALAAFDEHRAACISLVRPLAPERLVRTRIATMRLDEFVKTRVLELAVHGFDLADALGSPPWLTSGGEAVTMALLSGLLGEPVPPSLAQDPVDFIEKGTGRRALSDADRSILGGRADRFPLLG